MKAGPLCGPSPASQLPQARLTLYVWNLACPRWAAKQPQHFAGSPRIMVRLTQPGKPASHVYPIETAA